MKQDTSGDESSFIYLQPLMSKILSFYDFKKIGYTKSQILIFSALSMRENLTMGQVAGYLSSSKEQATRVVAPLVDDGLVERYVDPENRTRIHIRLTPQGAAFMDSCRNRFQENLHTALAASLTEEEQLELRRSLDSMIRILSKLN